MIIIFHLRSHIQVILTNLYRFEAGIFEIPHHAESTVSNFQLIWLGLFNSLPLTINVISRISIRYFLLWSRLLYFRD